MSTFEIDTADLLRRGFEGFKSASLEERVQELMDREEIRELAARYAQRVSRRQSMADLFTDDGAFIVHMPNQPVQVTRGREQLEKAFAAAISSPALNMPAVHNHVISITGSEAIGTSWIELYTLDGDERSFAGCGYYEDRLRRDNGRWKFVVREANVLVVGSKQRR
jgi:ketosteroid isomerase-like protein